MTAEPPKKGKKGCACAVLLALLSCCIATYLANRNEPKQEARDGTAFKVPAEPPATQDATSLALILDTSGSMTEYVGGQSKIDVAHAVLTEDFLPVLADELYVSAYQFHGSTAGLLSPLRRNSAQDAPRWLHREAVMELVELTDTGGATPIAGSIRKVRGDLASVPGRRLIVLVTDGEESYETKESVLREIEACRAAGIEVYVVGFNLGSQGEYLHGALGLGKNYFQANGGREELLKAMSSIAAALEK